MTADALSKIVVTPGDLSGQLYEILGPIEFPGRDQITVRGRSNQDLLRQAAAGHNGRVDAIIGYTVWQDGQQERCGGTAVLFRSAGARPVSLDDCLATCDGKATTEYSACREACRRR